MPRSSYEAPPSSPTAAIAAAIASEVARADAAYAPVAEPLAVKLSTVTAADDLIVATASGAVTNLAVPASRIILKKAAGTLVAGTAAEAQAILGYTAVGLGAVGRLFTTGQRYSPMYASAVAGALTLNELRLMPLWAAEAVTLDRIGTHISGGGTAGSIVRLGIWNDTGHGKPGTLLLDAGSVDSTATGLLEITISQALAVGLYWIGVVSQVAAPTGYKVRGIGLTPTNSSMTNAGVAPACWTATGVSGTLTAYGTYAGSGLDFEGFQSAVRAA